MGLKCFELVHFRPLPEVVKNTFEEPKNTAYSPTHHGKRASQTGFKLCRLKTQVWFEDEKCTKDKVLSHSWFLTHTHSIRCGIAAIIAKTKSCCYLNVFPSSPVIFLCKFRDLSIRSEDLTKLIHLPAHTTSPQRNQDRKGWKWTKETD